MNMPPATPQRPGPGAYINTPARPPPFQMGALQPQQQQQAPAPAPVPTQIQRAADAINRMLQVDNRYPGLEMYTPQGSSGEYDLPTNQAWAPFQKLRSYEHPEGMYDQVNEMQMSVDMGLFAEINHAYVAVDNQLYLWDYTAQRPELIGFEELRDNITCVKLVKPRAKVFVDTISWLLVIATTTEMVLIAVETKSGPEGVHEVTLYRTGMSASVRRTNVTAIAGSAKTGRIFFTEADTEDVYELCYQQEEKWFSNRCSTKNHVASSVGYLPSISFGKRSAPVGVTQVVIDDSRNLLYTLSTNSTVKVYHMRTATTLENVIKRDLRTIKNMMSHYIGFQVPVLENLKIVGIDPISASEADNVSLMITSSTGVRIYMSATSGGYGPARAPTDMAVRHIRFPPQSLDPSAAPPPNTTNTQMQAYQRGTSLGTDSKALTKTLATFRYAPGTFLCAVEKNPTNTNHDLFLSSAHTGQLLGGGDFHFTETAQNITLRGKLQDAGLVTPPFFDKTSGNEFAVQFDAPAAEYAIMTHYGIETVRRRRLVDTFAAIIRYGGGNESVSEDIRRFAKHYGLTETASTALAVACGQGADVGADSRIVSITDPEIVEVARKAFIDYGGKPQIDESATVEGLSVDSVRPSQRHDGIALYVARLVRSIWDTPIIKETVKPTGPVLEPYHDVAKLQAIQTALLALQRFLDENKTFIDGLAGPEALGRASSRREEVELQGENRALTSLLQMIKNIAEGIAFSLVLFEERLEDILLFLSPDTRVDVRKLTFHALFATSEGRDLAKELVKAIVNHNIAKGSNVETVAEALRRKCGSFCSSDDVVIFKASENLKKAADLGANAERGRIQLNDSLRLFLQVAKSLTMENLAEAVYKYIQLEFYAGAIRLALKVADERDRGNRALSWIKDNQPDGDARQHPYIQRTNCYRLIFNVIEAVDKTFGTQGNVQQEGAISQIGRRKQEAYQVINDSDDEVFQRFLYDWYMEKGWADRLLEIESPYVVEYLKQSSENNQAHADLLWKYYAHHNDYLGAAEVQFQLAKKKEFDLSLEQRIEYLSRAKANASTRIAGFSDSGMRSRQTRQELLRNISDHLDVANIQDDLVQKIQADPRFQSLSEERKQEMLSELNKTVRTVDDLFNIYTDQAGYYDISLLLFHQADLRDMSTIRTTWANFIEQTHNDAVDQGKTSPWESVAIETETLGRRVGANQNMFPVTDVFQLLLQYDVQKYRRVNDATGNLEPEPNTPNANNPDATNPIAWPIDIFVRLNAPLENLVSVLEAMWYARSVPYNSRAGRKLLAKWLVCVVEKWWETTRRSGEPFGGTENTLGLSDVLRVVMEAGDFEAPGGTAEDALWMEKLRVVREKVEEVLR